MNAASCPPPCSDTPHGTATDDIAAAEAVLLGSLTPHELDALRWSTRIADGLDAASQQAFEHWLAADPRHARAYADIATVWEELDTLPPRGVARIKTNLILEKAASQITPNSGIDADTDSDISTAAGDSGAEAQIALPQPRPHRRLISGVLACAFCASTAIAGWLGWHQWQGQVVFERQYATQQGQLLDAALPDGSTLLLDTATRVQVTLYRNRREVRLESGQILATVQHDTARPFSVGAGDYRVTALGTRFAVRHLPERDGARVQVSVAEGHVGITAAPIALTQLPAHLELFAGQKRLLDPNGQDGGVVAIAPERVAEWRHQRLSFDDVPLGTVLAELERYGRSGLIIRDPAVAALPVTASIDLRRLGDFTRALQHALPVRMEARDGAMEIVATAAARQIR